jgi:hypothetical protein
MGGEQHPGGRGSRFRRCTATARYRLTMGTSADRATGTGGAWTPLKRAATDYARTASAGSGGTRVTAERVLGRHVAVLGGAGAAAASARAGTSGLARLGGVLAGIGNAGLGPTLDQYGLGHLVGTDRFDVLDGLITLIAGDAADVESQAARDAACDVLDELYADAVTWAELETAGITPEMLQTLLTMFLARYVYNRLPVLAERLARLTDPAAARDADRQIVEMIQDLVILRMPDQPLTFGWSGPEGRRFADETIHDVYDILGKLGQDGNT